MKTFLMMMVIVWFVLGAAVANDRGFFNANTPRTCTFVGSGLLTVTAGPVNYLGVRPHAFC